MSNGPQDTQNILSCWIKRPDSSKPETVTSTALGKPSPQQQWSDIFGKPPKHRKTVASGGLIENKEHDEHRGTNPCSVAGECEADKASQVAFVKSARRKPINPKSPFNSFMATMKVPRGLEFPCETSQGIDPHTASSDRSFWVSLKMPSSSFSSQEPETQNSAYETETESTCSSQPQNLSQTLEKSPERRANSQGSSAIASFFAKKSTKTRETKPEKRSSLCLKPTKPTYAPYDILHVRPQSDWSPQHVRKRSRALPDQENLSLHEAQRIFKQLAVSELEFPLTPLFTEIHKPVRRLMNATQLQTIAMKSLSIDSLSQTRTLSETISQQDAFDQGMFETRMWCEKYAPKKPAHHISPKSTEALSTWLYTQQERLDKTPTHKLKRAKRKTSLGGFIVDDRDLSDSELDNDDAIMILSGPSGCGKTSAVYAAGHNLNFFVFEINASTKRTGKELTRLLEGISRNHAVHSAKNVVILVDEADLVYENEAGTFWPTITKFASASRRPLVITCIDRSVISLPSLSFENIEMEPPSPVSLVDISYLIALKEGHLVDKLRLTELIAQNRNDLRKTLTSLQYWCQYGIGGLPSGADWVAKMDEICPSVVDDRSTVSSGNRVISDGTWFELPNEQCENTSLSEITNFMLERVPELVNYPKEIIERPEESLWVNSALPISQWQQPVQLPAHLASSERLNNCVFPFRYECPRTRIQTLLLDIAPYMRNMVVSDAQRQLSHTSAMAQLSEREQRMLLRSMRESGVDTRNYLGFTFPTMTRMLNTGFKMVSPPSGKIVATSPAAGQQ